MMTLYAVRVRLVFMSPVTAITPLRTISVRIGSGFAAFFEDFSLAGLPFAGFFAFAALATNCSLDLHFECVQPADVAVHSEDDAAVVHVDVVQLDRPGG